MEKDAGASAQTKFRFGELEAILADINEIPSRQRTAFAAKLKDFTRLDLLRMPELPKGKAASYGLRELVLLAIGVEMAQLGLSTKIATTVILEDEFPLWMALSMAARSIEERPEVFNAGSGDTGNPPDQKVWGFSPNWADGKFTDPFSVFLYFDPAALSPWADPEGGDEGQSIASATFFYAGIGVVADELHRWTTGPSRRISMINVTSLLFTIAAHMSGPEGLEVVKAVGAVANDWVNRGDFDLDGWLVNVAKTMGSMVAAKPTLRKERDDGKMTTWIPLNEVLTECPPEHDFHRITASVEQAIVDEGPDRGLRDRQIPDMIIRLPGQRQLMVDAKIYPMADIPQEGIWSRVEELAEQPYKTKFTDRTDYIVLYIPDEHFYASAVAADKWLFDRALEKKVVLATPAVFMNLIAEAHTAWANYRKEFPDLGEDEWAALNQEVISHGDS